MTAAITANEAPSTLTGTCGRCDGKGSIRAFGHVANGVCFACNGTGTTSVRLPGRGIKVESHGASYYLGVGSCAITLAAPAKDPRFGGVASKPRAELLSYAKSTIERCARHVRNDDPVDSLVWALGALGCYVAATRDDVVADRAEAALVRADVPHEGIALYRTTVREVRDWLAG